MFNRLPWEQELRIVDDTMKAISSINDPESFVDAYWNGVGQLVAFRDFVSVSRRNVEAPYYLVTRSSRFTEHPNPWTERDKLPKLTGGLLGEMLYAERPMVIQDLPARLQPDDPGYFYLQGFAQMIALPQYDVGVGLNATGILVPPGVEVNLDMVPMLHWQGGLLGRGTQNLVLRNQLASALAMLDRELQVVGDIQRSLLPHRLPTIPGFELAADYRTSARAGGDYYDFFPLDDGSQGLFIADVSGHGTPAAVIMAITHAIAHAQPGRHTPPGTLLDYLNDRLSSRYTRQGTFVTAFYATLDPTTRVLTYARAGHNPPRLVREGKVISLDGAGGVPLGISSDESYEQASVTLRAGDMLLLYTDGVTEAMPPVRPHSERELYGLDRLDQHLLAGPHLSAQACLDYVRAGIDAFTHNAPPNDDQTLLVIRVLD